MLRTVLDSTLGWQQEIVADGRRFKQKCCLERLREADKSVLSRELGAHTDRKRENSIYFELSTQNL